MRSLRGRLTLGTTIVLAAVIALCGGLVSSYVSRSEREALDERLQRTAELSRETALVAVERALPTSDRRLDAVLEASRTSLRILVGDAPVFETGSPPPTRPVPTHSGLRTFEADGTRYRAYTAPLQSDALGGLARLEVTSRLTMLEERLADLNRTLLAFGVGALALAAVGVWLAADLVLRPLGRLRALASRIAGEADLERRVPEDDGPSELRSLAASFNGMLARLGRSAADRERAMAATRRFAADAGHELRTPLTSIQATLSALNRHPAMNERQRGALVSDAFTEQQRLINLFDGLQALARGEAAPPQDEGVDLGAVIAAVVEQVASRHPAVRFDADLQPEPVRVCGWDVGLRMLIENLVENAARHGRPGVRVQVTLAAARDGRGPVLCVDDDGPGVPAAERRRIFEPFARADGTSASGSGLGLALVAQQVRLHEAEVDVERSPLGGARFRVELPLSRVAPAADTATEARAPTGH